MSDEQFLCQNVGLEVLHSTGVERWGTMGTRPSTIQPEGVSIGNVLTLFFSSYNKFKGIHSEPDHSLLLSTLHRSSSNINKKIIPVQI